MGLLEDIVGNLVSSAIEGMKPPTGSAPKPRPTSDRRQMETRKQVIANRNSRRSRGLATSGKKVRGTVDGRGTYGQRRWEAEPHTGGYMSGTGWRNTGSEKAPLPKSFKPSKNTNYWRVSDTADAAMKRQGVDEVADIDFDKVDRPEAPNWYGRAMSPYSFLTGVDFRGGESGETGAVDDLPWILTSLFGAKGVGAGINKYAGKKSVQKFGPQTWHEAGEVAPPNRQLPRGPYRMGPATDPITGAPTRFGGRVKDPRAGMEPTYSTNNIFKPFSGQGSLFGWDDLLPKGVKRGSARDPYWPPMPVSREVEEEAIGRAELEAMKRYDGIDPPWAR